MNHRGPVVQWMRDTAAQGWLLILLTSQLLVLLIGAWRSHQRRAEPRR